MSPSTGEPVVESDDRDMRCIERLPSGQYRCRVRRTKAGRRKQYVVSEAGSYDFALAARDTIEADERISGAGGVTVAEWGKVWLRRLKEAEAAREARRSQLVDAVNGPKKRPRDKEIRDLKNVESRLTRHILQSNLKDMPMRAVKAKHVEEFVEWLGERDTQHEYPGSREVGLLSRRTRERILTILRNLFKAAIKDKERLCRCTVNPALGIQVPLEEDEEEDLAFVLEDVPLDKREQAILIESYGGDPEKYLILVAIGTGLRQGEQWNLELRDVHLNEPDPNDPTKLESYIYVRWGSKGKPPKNGEPRKVPLFGLGLEAMERWLEALPTYAPVNPEGLVFPSRQIKTHKGKIQHRGGYRRGKSEVPTSFKNRQVEQILGEGRRFWWHALRHTCATGLLCAWWGRKWELLEISKMLGHKSLVVTQMYAKIVDKALLEVAAQAHAAYLQQQAPAATPPAAPIPPAPAGSVLEGLMLAARAAVEERNWTVLQSLGPMIDGMKGALAIPPPAVQAPPNPTPLPVPTPQPVLRTMPARAVRKGPAGRRPTSRSSTLTGSAGDSEGPRESGTTEQLIAMGGVAGLHSGSFSPPAVGSLDGLIVAASAPVATRRSKAKKVVPEVHRAPLDATGLIKRQGGHEVAMGQPAPNDFKHLSTETVGLRNRRSDVRIVPGAPINSDSCEDSVSGHGHHVATEEERGRPERRPPGAAESAGAREQPNPSSDEVASSATHTARAQRLMQAVAVGRQDAWRMAEDLAMALLMSKADRCHHEAARLVLKDPELRVPRALELAVRLMGPQPKAKKKTRAR